MSLLDHLQSRVPAMVDALETLVTSESPSSDPAATARCVEVARSLAKDLIGDPGEEISVDDRSHVRWRFGPRTKVILIGHLDTVWPIGTTDRWPFRVEGDVASGPGCFDMKGGVVQLLFALETLDDLDGIAVVLTTDEEIGSSSSRELLRQTAVDTAAALVLEPSEAGALKTARKGALGYRIDISGRAAHAGLDPEKGVNAAVEAAHLIHALGELARPDDGTTVTPSTVEAGTTSNTVPASASVGVDVRAFSEDELDRIDRSVGELKPVLEGAKLSVTQTWRCPPLPRSASADLYDLAGRAAAELGLPRLTEASVGGGSDGNFTAGVGIPTLDGLGAVGGGAHAEGEWVSISAMPQRAALVASLVTELTR